MSFREQYPNLEEDVVAPHPTDMELAELRVEVERLRTREAALVAALRFYADDRNYETRYESTTAEMKGLGRAFVHGPSPVQQEGGRRAREALAADPSTPATTEERP